MIQQLYQKLKKDKLNYYFQCIYNTFYIYKIPEEKDVDDLYQEMLQDQERLIDAIYVQLQKDVFPLCEFDKKFVWKQKDFKDFIEDNEILPKIPLPYIIRAMEKNFIFCKRGTVSNSFVGLRLAKSPDKKKATKSSQKKQKTQKKDEGSE